MITPLISSLWFRFLICFGMGSIPFAVISMAGSGIDIRKVGSGNPGFNNVLRVSKWRAVIALAGDMGKGYLALHWTMHTGDPLRFGWLLGFAAVIGHCYSPFLRFNGGKGIATSGGVMLALYPLWAVIALAYFTAARVTCSRLKAPEAGTLASLTTWVVFTLLMLIFVGAVHAYYAALMTLFLAWRHRSNLARLAGKTA